MMDSNAAYQITPMILMKAMQGEQDAIVYYEQLSKIAPDEQDMNLIQGIRNDEVGHLNAFANLYFNLTKQYPNLPQPNRPAIDTFVGGVKKSILDELDAYEFYRNVYLANCSTQVRCAFFKAFTDEIAHAAKLNYMYTKSLETGKR